MTHVQKDTAILLKEKGFNLKEVCDWMYTENEDRETEALKQPNRHDGCYEAPYHSTVLDWLRETNGLHVYVTCTYSEWYYSIQDTTGINLFNSTTPNDTHDTGIEAGIVHALKHYVK